MRARWLLPLLLACASPVHPGSAPHEPGAAPGPAAAPAVGPAPAPGTRDAPLPSAPDASAAPALPTLPAATERTRRELESAGFSPRDGREPGALGRGFFATGPRGPDDPAVASSRASAARVLDALFHHRFDRAPAPPVRMVLLPDARGYERFCRAAWGAPCVSPYGFYVPSERRIVVNLGPGIGTLSHELVHPIIEADFPRAPTWLDEGIASLFEAPILPGRREIHGATNWRTPTLKRELATAAGRQRVSLRALFALTDERFRRDGDERRNYAVARTFRQWMDANGWLFAFYRAYRDGHASDPSGQRAFAETTGKDLDAANDDWLRWADRL